MFAVGIIITLVFFFMGSPIFVAMGIGSAILSLLAFGISPGAIASFFIESINSFTMLAIPLFIFMGDLFLKSGSSKHLLTFIRVYFGNIKAGMGIATVVASAFFGAISGSSVACIAAIGSIMAPVMFSQNYNRGTTAGLIACSGAIGNLIPPSIFMILYGALLELNVATLFAAGLIPGLITGGLLCVTITLLMRKKEVSPLPPEAKKAKRRIFINALPTLIMPIIVLGGIYGGVFTPTEAAAVGTVYTIIVGFLIYRELNLKKLWKSLTDSLVIISSIFLLGAGAILIGRMFVLAGVPQAMSEFVVRANLSAASFLVLACGMMLVMGVFIEVLIILLVFVPIVYPSVLMLGINPIYFGIIVVISLLIGQATPPVATNLYASSLICNVPPQETARGITPFTLTLIVSLVITVAFPGLSLWLPRILGLPIK